jgi:hypothetical protein
VMNQWVIKDLQIFELRGLGEHVWSVSGWFTADSIAESLLAQK